MVAYRRVASENAKRRGPSYLELELALALGLHEYRKKTGVSGFCLALSGKARLGHGGLSGSTIASLHRRRSRRVERFDTAYMATAHSGDATRLAAQQVAKDAGAKHRRLDLQRAVDAHLELFRDMSGTTLSWDNPSDDLTLQNVQAR